MGYPPITVVDQHDHEIGSEQLSKVWEQGLYHRIVRIMVEDEKGRVLVQKRSPHMELYPNRWDNSASGHVDAGMTYREAAMQELREELGITDPRFELEETGYFFMKDTFKNFTMHNFNQVYRLHLEHQTIAYGPEEVAEVRWFTPKQLREFVAQNPDKVTPGLSRVVEQLYI